MDKSNKLVVFGSINVDHIISIDHLPLPGQTVKGSEYLVATGGKGANQAVAAARAGANITFLSAIGEDALGIKIKEELKSDGIDTSKIKQIPGESTGVAMIMVDDSAENVIAIYPGANTSLNASYVDSFNEEISDASYLLLQLEIPLEGVDAAIQMAKRSGVQVVLNPAPAQALSPELLSHVDIITPNETEAKVLTGIEVTDELSAQKAANFFHELGIGVVIITLGHKGVWLSQSSQGQLVPSYKVNAIDTIAAGDTFNGVFVSELITGHSVLDAVKKANAAAAITVTRKGAIPAIPFASEILEFLKTYRD